MGLSVWQLLIIAAVILVLFGKGKISEMMGDFGKGVKSFKQGMADEDKPDHRPADSPRISNSTAATTDTASRDTQADDKPLS